MEDNLIFKFDKLTLEEQEFWKEEWQKMEEEGGDTERRAALIQRIREGSKKIRKMDKMDRGRGRNPVKESKERKINPRVHQKSMDKKRLR